MKRLIMMSAFLLVMAAGPARSAVAPAHKEPFIGDVTSQARDNDAFRRVLFTGAHTQVVVMSIPPGGEIGVEQHNRVEQILVCVSGQGEVTLNGRKSPFVPGTLVVVTPGVQHNFVNTGSEPLKLYTVYSPPNHLDQRVQQTKADAEADKADAQFGQQVEQGRSGK